MFITIRRSILVLFFMVLVLCGWRSKMVDDQILAWGRGMGKGDGWACNNENWETDETLFVLLVLFFLFLFLSPEGEKKERGEGGGVSCMYLNSIERYSYHRQIPRSPLPIFDFLSLISYL